MSEHSIPAPPRSPLRPTNGPDPLPPLEHLRRHGQPGRDPWRAEARAAMPPAKPSGYEEILAARSALRARVQHTAAAEDRRAPADSAADRPAAAQRVPGRSARHGGWPLPRKPRRGLVVPGLVAAPACALLAFAWAASRHAPPVVPAGAPIPPSLVSYGGSDAATAAALSGGGDVLVFAVRDAGQALPGVDDAAPEDDASAPSSPGGVEEGRAAALPTEEEPTLATRGGGAAPLQAANAEPEPPVAGASPLFLTSDLDAEPVASGPRDGRGPPRTTGTETAASPAGAGPGPAPTFAGAGADLAAVEGHGPAFATPDRDAPALATGAVPGTQGQDGQAGRPNASAAAEPAGDMLPEEAVAQAAPGGTRAPVPIPEDGGEDAPRDPAVAEALGREPAPVAEAPPGGAPSALAGRPDLPVLAAVPDAAPPAVSSGADAAAAARAMASGGPAAAPPPRREQERVAAAATPLQPFPSAGGATPAKLRPGSPPSIASRAGAAPPPPDARCRAIILKAQLGEETSHAERIFLRSGCGARR